MTLNLTPFLALLAAAGLHAETLHTVDASAPVAEPLANTLKMGTAVSPSGSRIGYNSRFISLDGKPWLPVMGEFHYTRSPAAQWEAELRKMKAAGIDIVASYVIWNHHEPLQGQFNWQERRDLRRFVQAAQRAGLGVVVRIGPWAHAEVRFGGTPDWVVNLMPTRRNDPEYLFYVERLYRQIGQQLKGLMWKDGGPVVGVQLENEYNADGPGRGAEHILKLKELARAAGMDAPLYTVTGWDRAQYPSGEVTPVFGGYADEPWSSSKKELPPKETHAFRFDRRVSGDLGAQTRGNQRGTAETDMHLTPFFGAEYGAGVPFMYHRRPVVSPDDIAAMIPVQLGSGVNLLGYYMFHGGRNPASWPTLEETVATGAPNDLPMVNYDFQAPLGPDGQERPMLRYLRPYHLFLKDFGARLAPTVVRRPDDTPATHTDLAKLRWSLRSHGDSGFLFVNNHVRQYAMPDHKQLRFSVKLPGGTATLPSQPVDVPNGAYFIWPINFDLDGIRLAHATAQPLVRLDGGTYVFAASPGMPVELALPAQATVRLESAAAGTVEAAGGAQLVKIARPGTDAVVTVEHEGRKARVLVLSPQQARSLAVGTIAGQRRLVLSEDQVWFEYGKLQLRSRGEPGFSFSVYPALAKAPAGAAWRASADGVFQRYAASVQPVQAEAVATLKRPAGSAPAVAVGGRANRAMVPYPEQFGAAAAWQLQLSAPKAAQVEQYLLQPDVVGDVARLFDGTRLADDWFYSGYGWEYPVAADGAGNRALTLQLMPLRADAPIYLPKEAWPDFGGKPQAAELRGVKLLPVYRAEARF